MYVCFCANVWPWTNFLWSGYNRSVFVNHFVKILGTLLAKYFILLNYCQRQPGYSKYLPFSESSWEVYTRMVRVWCIWLVASEDRNYDVRRGLNPLPSRTPSTFNRSTLVPPVRQQILGFKWKDEYLLLILVLAKDD